MEIENLREYVWKNNGNILREIHAEEIICKGKKKDEIWKQWQDTYIERKPYIGCLSWSKWNEGMIVHWPWLSKKYFKKETKGMAMAAQDQSLRTRYIWKEIDKDDISSECRCVVIGKRSFLIWWMNVENLLKSSTNSGDTAI